MILDKNSQMKTEGTQLSAADCNLLIDTIDGLFREVLYDLNKPVTLLFENTEALKTTYGYILGHFEELRTRTDLSPKSEELVLFVLNNFGIIK